MQRGTIGIQILYVKDRKHATDERIVLKVKAQTANLRDYLILDSTFDEEGEISNLERHIFKFPAKEVVKDQFIVLYTRPRTEFKQGDTSTSGNTVSYSWNLDHGVWNDEGDHATLIEIKDFHSKPV